MSGKEQRVRRLAEKLASDKNANEPLAWWQAVNAAQERVDTYPHLTDGALCLLLGESDPRTLAREMVEENPLAAQGLAQAILGLTGAGSEQR